MATAQTHRGESRLKIVFISDTHLHHGSISVPSGDVLVHCGDFTNGGTLREIGVFSEWMKAQPHKHKIVVAGNHDLLFERQPVIARSMLSGVTYLQDSGIVIDGVGFYGSPWTPMFGNWAFMLERYEIAEKWELIPANTDVLITHGPPKGILDYVPGSGNQGCWDLLQAAERIKPKIHAFGHIHEGYGEERYSGIKMINAAMVDRHYEPGRPPIVAEL